MTSTVDKSWSSGGPRQRQRRRAGLISAGVLSSLLAGLVLAIPDLHTVANRAAGVHWEWVTLAAGLELASCVGYLLAFQGIFEELPRRFAALVAASEQAFGAVVPVGGAGGIAAGGWLLARRGMPLRRIAEGSAVLFLLTSASNVVALLVAAAGLALGLFPGPHDPVRTVVPAVVALSVLAIFLSLARQTARGGAPRLPWARSRAQRALADTTNQTLRVIARPGWRVGLGAPAYLLCDIAVLWLTIHALGYNTPAASLIVAYLLGYLANALPVPGGIGVLDGGLAGALVAYHVPAATAFGGVLVYHAVALWIPTASGTLAFIAAQRDIAIGERRRTQTSRLSRGESRTAGLPSAMQPNTQRSAGLVRPGCGDVTAPGLRRSTFEGKSQVG